jgi:hypothetical protein
VREGGTAHRRLRARADVLWRLLRGHDDGDRGAPVMEGDTEYGLTLDAIGLMWSPAAS